MSFHNKRILTDFLEPIFEIIFHLEIFCTEILGKHIQYTDYVACVIWIESWEHGHWTLDDSSIKIKCKLFIDDQFYWNYIDLIDSAIEWRKKIQIAQ